MTIQVRRTKQLGRVPGIAPALTRDKQTPGSNGGRALSIFP